MKFVCIFSSLGEEGHFYIKGVLGIE